ncbi:MAG TPA: hypothetical protein VK638_34345 [Edaphobacter sp.]|nr:hypothetical protein [Edaphobacter sp.]
MQAFREREPTVLSLLVVMLLLMPIAETYGQSKHDLHIQTMPAVKDDFSLQPPRDLSTLAPKQVWFTDYISYLTQEDLSPTSVALRNLKGDSLGVSISRASWCRAAVEGTVTVVLATHQRRHFNFETLANKPLTNCSDVLMGYTPSQIRSFERTLFSELPHNAPFGTGVKAVNSDDTYRLIPGRSVAIDMSRRSAFRVGDVLYVPELRKLMFTLQDGRSVHHDGYVMAVDNVGTCGDNLADDCNGNRLDYFKGEDTSDVLPAALESSPQHTLVAYIVTDPAIITKLRSEHLRH